MRGVAAGGAARTVGQRAIVLDQAFQRFPGEIEAIEIGIAPLQIGDDAQRLGVVVEAAVSGETIVERALAGMAEGRMAKIVRQRQRLGQILVEPKRAGKRARDLRHFQCMREPRPIMVALVIDEHLRLVREPPERRRMDDAVAVAAEIVARGAWRFGITPPPALARIGGINGPRAPGFDRQISPLSSALTLIAAALTYR